MVYYPTMEYMSLPLLCIFKTASARHSLASECEQSPKLLLSSLKSPEGCFSLALLNCSTEIAKHQHQIFYAQQVSKMNF